MQIFLLLNSLFKIEMNITFLTLANSTDMTLFLSPTCFIVQKKGMSRPMKRDSTSLF